MTRMTVRQKADEGEVYTPGCFDAQIGRSVPFRFSDGSFQKCTVISAEVAPDGESILITLDIPQKVSRLLSRGSAVKFSLERPS
jgi:hypothetical protein